MKKSTLVAMFVMVGVIVVLIIGSSIQLSNENKKLMNPIVSETSESSGVSSTVVKEEVTDIPKSPYQEDLLNNAIKSAEQEISEDEETEVKVPEQQSEPSEKIEPVTPSDEISSPEQPTQKVESDAELPAEKIIEEKKIELTKALYKDFLVADFNVTGLTAKAGVSLGKLKQDAEVVFKWSEGYCVGDSRSSAEVLLPNLDKNYSTPEEAFKNAKVLQANISLVVPEFFYKEALSNESDRFSIIFCVNGNYYEIQFNAIVASVGNVSEYEKNPDNTPTVTPSDTGAVSEETSEELNKEQKKESIYPTVDYTTVVHGTGIVLASDEYVATASGHCVGLTMRENAKYVLATQAAFYCLKYTAVEWDGYLLQDVSVGDAFSSYEEAVKASDKVPSGVNMYLPLNVEGISSMKEFNEAADDIRLLIIEGDNVSEVSYADFIS